MLKPSYRYLRKPLPVQHFGLHNQFISFPVIFAEIPQSIIHSTLSVVPGSLLLWAMKGKMSGLTTSRQGNLFSPT
jgi:hypothetical protein